MGDAGAAVTGKMGGFVGTFAPEATEDLFTKIVKGFAETTISMLVGQALGPVFGRLSEQIADGILEPVFGTIQDGIGKAIDEGIASGEL
jgi:hypothetical protein